MKLQTTRKIIAAILEIIIAISTVIFLFSAIMTFTVADKNYFINHFATQELASECNRQLELKYDVLSHETSIPARIFTNVEKDYPTMDALRQAVLSVFSEENETLYSQNKVDYFYELCVEYLDGNEISYKKKDVENAAERAAVIYSECVGIHNTAGLKEKFESFLSIFPKITVLSAIVAVVCFPVIMIMFKRKKNGYLFALGGYLSGAAATGIASLMLILFGVGSKMDIQPEIYKNTILSIAKQEFFIIGFISIFAAVGIYSAMRILNKKIQDED